MATIDMILGSGSVMGKKPLPVSPVAFDSSMQGASSSVGSEPADNASQTKVSSRQQASKVAPAGATKASSPASRPVAGETSPRQMSYVELYEALNPNKPETAEERAKREKKEKSQAIFAAIGDGISALSNLYFTTQYAPNAYDPSKGMSAATKERWEKLRQIREANQRVYADGYMRAMAIDETADREERTWRHGLEREKVADERYAVKAAQDKALADLNEKLRAHQVTTAEYKAEKARIEALYADETEQLKQDNLKADIEQKKAAAGASRSRGRYYDNGGGNGGGNGKKLTLTIGGKTYTYGSKEDYERAVERYAKEYGVRPYNTYADGMDGRKKKYTTKRKSTAQLAAEVESKAAGEFSEYEIPERDEEEDDFSEFEM